jgi:hypothetical protein
MFQLRSAWTHDAKSFRTPRPNTPSRTPELTPPRTARFRGLPLEIGCPSVEKAPAGLLSAEGSSAAEVQALGGRESGHSHLSPVPRWGCPPNHQGTKTVTLGYC